MPAQNLQTGSTFAKTNKTQTGIDLNAERILNMPMSSIVYVISHQRTKMTNLHMGKRQKPFTFLEASYQKDFETYFPR